MNAEHLHRIRGTITQQKRKDLLFALLGLIALSICFLLSDWSRHITGEILNINGGAVLCG